MFNKKAQSSTMTLEELVKLILGLLLFILLVAFLVFMYKGITTKTPSAHESDFNRVITDINSFTIESKEVKTPIFSKDIVFRSFKNKNTPIVDCGNSKNCLCYKKEEEKDSKFRCKELSISEPLEIVDNNLIKPTDNNLVIYKDLNIIKLR